MTRMAALDFSGLPVNVSTLMSGMWSIWNLRAEEQSELVTAGTLSSTSEPLSPLGATTAVHRRLYFYRSIFLELGGSFTRASVFLQAFFLGLLLFCQPVLHFNIQNDFSWVSSRKLYVTKKNIEKQ